MKVTPVGKKFGKYNVGDVFDFPDKPAKVFIKIGKLKQATEAQPTYQTRMMTAADSKLVESRTYEESEIVAPYGYKADGTPRARPGRPAKAE